MWCWGSKTFIGPFCVVLGKSILLSGVGEVKHLLGPSIWCKTFIGPSGVGEVKYLLGPSIWCWGSKTFIGPFCLVLGK